MSPCQFPSSFYRAYTTLISSSNDNTLHIYDRSRDNQKDCWKTISLSSPEFLSKVSFPPFVATFRIVSAPFTTQSPNNQTTVHNTITTNFYIHSATKICRGLQFLMISMRFGFSSAVEYLLFLHCGTYQSCRVACSAVPGRDTFIYHNNRDNSIPAQS